MFFADLNEYSGAYRLQPQHGFSIMFHDHETPFLVLENRGPGALPRGVPLHRHGVRGVLLRPVVEDFLGRGGGGGFGVVGRFGYSVAAGDGEAGAA